MEKSEIIKISSEEENGSGSAIQIFLSGEKKSEPKNPRFHLFHHHPKAQFVFVLRGSLNCVLPDRKLSASKGGLLFLPSGCFHQLKADPDSEYLSILFNGSSSTEENKGWILLPEAEQPPLALHLFSACRICAADILQSENKPEEQKYRQDQIKILLPLLEALKRLIESDGSQSPAVSSKDKAESRFLRMVSFMESRLQENISAGEIAESADISVSEAARCFHKLAGTTPGQYLMELRLQKAASLLEKSEKPVTEIGACRGFCDPSYFSACFRKAFGISPRAYRKAKAADRKEALRFRDSAKRTGSQPAKRKKCRE